MNPIEIKKGSFGRANFTWSALSLFLLIWFGLQDIALSTCQATCDAASGCLECETVSGSDCCSCDPDGSKTFFHESAKTCVATECPDGTFIVGNKICKDCDGSCETCNGEKAKDCLTCDSSGSTPIYYKTQRTCNATGACPNGTYADGNDCKDCHSSCLTCDGANDTDCLSCDTSSFWHGYYNTLDDKCVREPECPLNTYTDGSQQCQSCDASCTTCDAGTSSDCLSCPDNFYLLTTGFSYSLSGTCVSSADCTTASGYANDNSGHCEEQANTACGAGSVSSSDKRCHKWARWCSDDCTSYDPPTTFKVLEGNVASQQYGTAHAHLGKTIVEQKVPGSVATQDRTATTNFETFEGCLWTIDGTTLRRFAIDTFWDSSISAITTRLGDALQTFDVAASSYNGSFTISGFKHQGLWWNPWQNQVYFPLTGVYDVIVLEFTDADPCKDIKTPTTEVDFQLKFTSYTHAPVYYETRTIFYGLGWNGGSNNRIQSYNTTFGTTNLFVSIGSRTLNSHAGVRDIGYIFSFDNQTGYYQRVESEFESVTSLPSRVETSAHWKFFQARPGPIDENGTGMGWRPVYAVKVDSGIGEGNLYRITNEIQLVYTDDLEKFDFMDRETDIGRFRIANFGVGSCAGNKSAQYAHVNFLCLGNPGYQICDCLDINADGCGDGIVQAGESCDDGNTKDGDACSSTCTQKKLTLRVDGSFFFKDQFPSHSSLKK